MYKIAEAVKNFAVLYVVDISEVADFNKMYELYDPCTIMFFYRNKHIMIDLGKSHVGYMCVCVYVCTYVCMYVCMYK